MLVRERGGVGLVRVWLPVGSGGGAREETRRDWVADPVGNKTKVKYVGEAHLLPVWRW